MVAGQKRKRFGSQGVNMRIGKKRTCSDQRPAGLEKGPGEDVPMIPILKFCRKQELDGNERKPRMERGKSP